MTEDLVIEDPYESFRQKMDKWPVRAPKSKEMSKLLKEIFTYEEAELLSYFKTPLADQASPIEIAERSNKPLEDVINILHSLANRGLIFRLGKSKKRAKFAILPFVIGIYETFFSNAKIWTEEKKKRVAKLFEKYYERYLLPTGGASKYPFPRVLPSKTSEKIIKVDEELGDVSQKILTFEELEDLLNQYTAFSVMPCSCRIEHQILGDVCNKPIDVCMTFDMNAEFFIDIGMAKRLTKDEAIDLLKDCEKHGLVHMTLNSQMPDFICNCCNDCCGILKSLTKYHQSGMFATSNFKASINESIECNECFRCTDLCPTHAILPIIEPEEKLQFNINEELCIGCGLCSSNCPTNRYVLVKVKNEVPEKTMPDTYTRYGKERFRYKYN